MNKLGVALVFLLASSMNSSLAAEFSLSECLLISDAPLDKGYVVIGGTNIIYVGEEKPSLRGK